MAYDERQIGFLILEEMAKLRVAVERLQRGIEIVLEQTVIGSNELQQLKYQVGALSEGLQEIETRVSVLETHNSTIKWIARQLVTIAIAGLGAYLVTLIT